MHQKRSFHSLGRFAALRLAPFMQALCEEMKKRTRKIIVEQKSYLWLADETLFPECKLKVWLEGEKIKPFLEMLFHCENAVTPNIVAITIKFAIENLTSFDSKCVLLEWDGLAQKPNIKE